MDLFLLVVFEGSQFLFSPPNLSPLSIEEEGLLALPEI